MHIDLFEEVSKHYINLALYVRLGNERVLAILLRYFLVLTDENRHRSSTLHAC